MGSLAPTARDLKPMKCCRGKGWTWRDGNRPGDGLLGMEIFVAINSNAHHLSKAYNT